MRELRRIFPKRSDSFTLIELLVVMTIIAILTALVLYAAGFVIKKGMRDRALTEIKAMEGAAEAYKADNGIFPQGDGNLLTNNYTSDDGSTPGGEYQANSALLYAALSGQTNFATPPVAGIKVYLSFKANQIGNLTAGNSYIMDPWRNAYGYSTGTTTPTSTNYPYSGNGFFDLWSTAGVTKAQVSANPVLTNAWLSSWSQ